MVKSQFSKNAQKCYNIAITGKVQDIGFRALIEDIARLHDLRGFAFNDIDGSVKMVCCGESSVINEFLDELRFRGIQKGAVIDEVAKEEITSHIFLPQRFLRLYTDELADIGRKLDIGNEYLRNLPEIKDMLCSFVGEQRNFNKEIRDHNMRLEKILEKLAEK